MTRRQTWWALAAALAGALCVCALGSWAFALTAATDKPTLVYDGATESFTYRNVEGTDLFASFKNLVPGDHLTQHFTIRAENLTSPTTVYLRTSYDADEVAALEAVELSVAADGAEVARGSVARPNRLDDNTRIAVFPQDGTHEATVEIAVPTSVGNEMMGAEHHLRWTFTAQEEGENGNGATAKQPTTSAASSTIATTGDPITWALIPLATAVAALTLFLIALRKARRP